MVALYRAGKSTVYIAVMLELSPRGVEGALKRLGELRSHRVALDPAVMRQALLTGQSYNVIARNCRVSRSTLQRHIRAHGLPRSVAIGGRPRLIED